MKKKISIILLMALIFSLVPSNGVSAAKKISLNKKSLSLVAGKSKNLKLKNAKKSKVRWSSSNKSVATVNKTGKVKAKKKGKTIIFAKYQGKKYKCKVTVQSKTSDSTVASGTKQADTAPKPGASTALPSGGSSVEPTAKPTVEPTAKPTEKPEGVLNYRSVSIDITQTVELSLSGATAESWRSSDEDIAFVWDGVVIPSAIGSVQIYCRDTKGFEYSCSVTVGYPDITMRPDSIYSQKIGNSTYYGIDFIVKNNCDYDIKFGGKDSMTDKDFMVTYFYQYGFNQDLTAAFALNPVSPFDTTNMNQTIVCKRGYETPIYALEGTRKYLPTATSHFLWTVSIDGIKYIMVTDFYGDIVAMVTHGLSDI